MERFSIAGAESIPDLAEIKKAFLSIGAETEFVEAPFMREYHGRLGHLVPLEKDSGEQITYTNLLPDCSVVIPLTEYWISYCREKGQCRISQKALDSSRSKKYFYNLMAMNGVESPVCFSSREEAENALANSRQIIIKPEGLFSGLGVLVVQPDEKNLLDDFIRQAQAVRTKNMRLMKVSNGQCMMTEYLPGTEYSADCFYYKGRISLVRVCRKKVIILAHKPCTAVYEIIKPSPQIESSLKKWMEILFDKDNVSFAQFDFIISADGTKIVPIDFASRIGGGMFELMSNTGTNPYADAVRGECRLYESGTIFTQLNYLPVKDGTIINDDYNLAEGYQFIFKKKGDHVIANPSSIGSRVALVIQKRKTPVDDSILSSLLIDERSIS